jgi:CheY-like chemotaxis protein
MRNETLNILLIEDNLDHAELIMRSFQEHRITNRLYHMTNGEEALEYLFREGIYKDPALSPHPHLILLDLRLPRIDGLEVLGTIRSSPQIAHIPIVVLTTSQTEQDVARAYHKHVNSYLVKPVNFDNFTRMMEDLGFYWLTWNHYPWPEANS